jgi:hypothetical protein
MVLEARVALGHTNPPEPIDARIREEDVTSLEKLGRILTLE